MSEPKSKNITMHDYHVSKEDRHKRHGQRSAILWFTGLSGSGKSTIANALEKKLFEMDLATYALDGDNIRHGLNKNLGFSPEDRDENIRRIGEVAKLFVDAGVLTTTAFISPYKKARQDVRDLVEEGEFIEVFVRCPLEVCEERDTKGLYKKARAGEIKGFTGIDAPYEEPTSPEVTVDSDKLSVDEAIDQIIEYLKTNDYLEA